MFFKRSKSGENEEKRRFPRIDFFQSSYYLPIGEENSARACWFFNISHGGIGFEAEDARLKNGDEIQILLKFGTKIRREAAVVQFAAREFSNYRYGCAFTAQDMDRTALIDEYVQQNGNQGKAS